MNDFQKHVWVWFGTPGRAIVTITMIVVPIALALSFLICIGQFSKGWEKSRQRNLELKAKLKTVKPKHTP